MHGNDDRELPRRTVGRQGFPAVAEHLYEFAMFQAAQEFTDRAGGAADAGQLVRRR